MVIVTLVAVLDLNALRSLSDVPTTLAPLGEATARNDHRDYENRSQQGTANAQRDGERDARIREARERGRRIMEPGDDLSMPLGQKIVLIVMAVVVVAIVATMLLAPK